MAPSVDAILGKIPGNGKPLDRVSHRKFKPELKIEDYNPSWPVTYEQLRSRIASALGPAVATDIQHVGSTSVPGLAAKGIIDIDLTVQDISDEAAYVPQLEAAGFQFLFREPGWHEHRFFCAYEPMVNLHVFPVDGPEQERHRIFRDWLRSNDDDRERYAAAKRAAAEATVEAGETLAQYTDRKDDVIREILQKGFRQLGYIE